LGAALVMLAGCAPSVRANDNDTDPADEDDVDDVVAMSSVWMPGIAGGGGTLGDPMNLNFATPQDFADADGDGHVEAPETSPLAGRPKTPKALC
jgi:hypothetical protein